LQQSEASSDWTIPLPAWCADQRNQMTGPADDAELVVKMLNSGALGVMLDLEDSMANTWSNLRTGLKNIDAALRGELTYFDAKRKTNAGINESKTVIFTRPRGLHISQAGVLGDELMSASLFDVATVAYQADLDRLRHPLSFYIPKSESHPLAYQMEEFVYNLRDHIIGLNLGRWDYMASLIHFNLEDPEWVLPDRNTIPHNVPFFQNLRELLAETCHKHGILAIGGMTALYPSRTDAELNERALRVLAEDKKNEANCLMDGAWTGHPDQNEIAVQQFPFPNQVHARKPSAPTHPDLRPIPTANLAGHMYPDQSLYPANSVPDVVRKINQSLQRADQIDHAEGRNGIDWFVPIVADAEAGFGGNLNAFELMKAMIEAGAAAVHFEDQLASAKKCGHMGGKVLVPTQEFIQKLIAARLAADVLGVDTILVARTDADGAGLLTSDVDERDHAYLTGSRTAEGFFTVKAGLDQAIARALA
jgi:malate synthase